MGYQKNLLREAAVNSRRDPVAKCNQRESTNSQNPRVGIWVCFVALFGLASGHERKVTNLRGLEGAAFGTLAAFRRLGCRPRLLASVARTRTPQKFSGRGIRVRRSLVCMRVPSSPTYGTLGKPCSQLVAQFLDSMLNRCCRCMIIPLWCVVLDLRTQL